MVRARLPGINTITKRDAAGRVVAIYYYHRRTGLRLRGAPNSAEFVESYAAAEASARGRHTEGTLAALIRGFLLSAEFNTLAESTQKEYRRIATVVEARFGTAPLAVIADPRFAGDALSWRDSIASKPREADNRMVVFGRILNWSTKRHLVPRNVLAGYERLHRADRADKIWLPEHIAALQREASDAFWPIFLVALHTGLRQGDIRRLPWSAYDGDAITWRITKRRKGDAGVQVRIKCTSALRSMLDGLPRRGPLIFTTSTGMAWQKRYLFEHFDRARTAAAKHLADVAELHFHDLRGTAITMLAEAGCNVPEIAAITGHSYRTVTSILERYLPRTRHLADMAMTKLENSGRTDFANRLQTGSPASTKGGAK